MMLKNGFYVILYHKRRFGRVSAQGFSTLYLFHFAALTHAIGLLDWRFGLT